MHEQTLAELEGAVAALVACGQRVSRSTLVGRSSSDLYSRTEEYEARVWDLETLEPLLTLRQPAGRYVLGLASDWDEVWWQSGRMW